MYHTYPQIHDSEDTPEHFFASPNLAVCGIVLHNWLHKTSSSPRVLARLDRVRQAEEEEEEEDEEEEDDIFLQAHSFFSFKLFSALWWLYVENVLRC